MPCFVKYCFTPRFVNSFPLSDLSKFSRRSVRLKMFLNPVSTLTCDLSGNASTQRCFEKTSIKMRRNCISLLCLDKLLTSAKSTSQKSSIPLVMTLFHLKRYLTGCCNVNASWFCNHLFTLV